MMIRKSLKRSLFYGLSVLFLISCATPTISKKINRSAIVSEQHLSNDISDAYLIGGGGGDWARKIICSDDNSCTLFGYTIKSFGETTDFLAVKESLDQGLIWAKTYGGTHKDQLQTAIATKDKGYLLLGKSYSLFFTPLKAISPNRPPRPLIIKVDSYGEVQWATTVDRNVDYLSDVIQTVSGEYLLVGLTSHPFDNNSEKNQKQDPPQTRVVILKLSGSGDLIFSNSYEVEYSSVGESILPAPDGSFLISGYSKSEKGHDNAFILNINIDGETSWAKIYESNIDQWPFSLTTDKTGNWLIGGYTHGENGRNDYFVLKVSPVGSVIWAESYKESNGGTLHSVKVTRSNDILLVGQEFLNEKDKAGAALLINEEGKIIDRILVGTQTELLSGEQVSNNKFRLLGDTTDFKAAFVDMIAFSWKPRLSKEHIDFTSEISQMKLEMIEHNLKPKKTALSTKLVNIPITNIESTTLITDKPADGISKTQLK